MAETTEIRAETAPAPMADTMPEATVDPTPEGMVDPTPTLIVDPTPEPERTAGTMEIAVAQKPSEPSNNKACPSCGSSKEPGKDFCDGCIALMSDMIVADSFGEFELETLSQQEGKSLTALTRSNENYSVNHAIDSSGEPKGADKNSSEPLMEHRNPTPPSDDVPRTATVEKNARRKLDLGQSQVDKCADKNDSPVQKRLKREGSNKNVDDLWKDEASNAVLTIYKRQDDLDPDKESPVRRHSVSDDSEPFKPSGSTKAVVTPPCSQTEDEFVIQDESCNESLLVSLKIDSTSEATKQWLFDAQKHGMLLQIQVPTSSQTQSTQGQIMALTVLTTAEKHKEGVVHEHSKVVIREIVPTKNVDGPVVISKNACVDCGGKTEDTWRKKCKKCFAIAMMNSGVGNKDRRTCNDCGITTEETWMYKCRKCFSMHKAKNEACEAKNEHDNGKGTVTGESQGSTALTSKAEGGGVCQHCGEKTDYYWMTRCPPCYAKWRQSHETNHGGVCRYCNQKLDSELKTTCRECFVEHKVKSPRGSDKCPDCGKKPDEPWKIWCHECFHSRKKK
ncbi:hypothetical protein ACA910_005294 [Epithemia clementina (nom. ined.)]